ncbi:MAG: TonB C-terminal domain-containing protein [Sulfurovum sp.]|nr:TonB C-terminal domain-containing protein [Sulfurovum sp.]
MKYLWGVVAVGIYLFVVGMLVFYFNHKETEQKKRYVKKDEHRIQVALSAPKKKVLPTKKKQKAKPKPRAKSKPEPKPKQKSTHKRVIKEKIVRKTVKKRDLNVTKSKRKKPKDLFKNVKTVKKPLIKVSDKPIVSKPKKQLFEITKKAPSASERIRNSLKKQKQMDSGVEDAYLAHVQEMLEGWPAQSDFAGEKVKVHLKIDPTGHFEFIIKRKSANPNFNRALTEYLKQLQEFGFGPHKGGRTYLFEAEFIAKD